MSEVDVGQAADDGRASDQTRRRFLTAATSGISAVGVVGVAVPFLGSWNPSEKAKAAGAPVKADISKIEPGQMVVVEWRGKPVYVLRRTPEQIAGLPSLDGSLKDPNSDGSDQPAYISGAPRSLNEEYLVVVGLCTHLGCAPKFRPEVGAADLGGDSWLGGSFARVTVQSSIWRDGFIRVFLPRITSSFRLIRLKAITYWSSALTRRLRKWKRH